jgi:hypothetical protein
MRKPVALARPRNHQVTRALKQTFDRVSIDGLGMACRQQPAVFLVIFAAAKDAGESEGEPVDGPVTSGQAP